MLPPVCVRARACVLQALDLEEGLSLPKAVAAANQMLALTPGGMSLPEQIAELLRTLGI